MENCCLPRFFGGQHWSEIQQFWSALSKIAVFRGNVQIQACLCSSLEFFGLWRFGCWWQLVETSGDRLCWDQLVEQMFAKAKVETNRFLWKTHRFFAVELKRVLTGPQHQTWKDGQYLPVYSSNGIRVLQPIKAAEETSPVATVTTVTVGCLQVPSHLERQGIDADALIDAGPGAFYQACGLWQCDVLTETMRLFKIRKKRLKHVGADASNREHFHWNILIVYNSFLS